MQEKQELIETVNASIGQEVWDALVAQAPISATFTSLLLIVIGIFGTLLAQWIVEYGKKQQEDWRCMTYGSLGIMYTMMVGSCMHRIYAGFCNPEYWAIADIAKKLGGW
jgi:hypothetical protein